MINMLIIKRLLIILITGYFARESEHRGFSHSLMAFGLYGIGIFLFSKLIIIPPASVLTPPFFYPYCLL